MTRLWIGAFAICTLAPLACAQRGGGAPGGGMGFHGGGKGIPIGTTGGQSGLTNWPGIPPIGLPQTAPIGGVPQQAFGNGLFGNGGLGFGGLGFGGLGFGGLGFGGLGFGGMVGFDGGYEQSPPMMPPINLIIPQPPAPPPPPPEPARPVMNVYHWADTPTVSNNSFAIVQKDGHVRNAVAVWPQDGMVAYTDPGGTTVRIAYNAIDREATERINTERGLKLWLVNRH